MNRVKQMFFVRQILLLAGLICFIGCSKAGPSQFGPPVDRSAAVRLSELLANKDVDPSKLQVVSGRVGNVCKSAGCWFVLQEVKNGKTYELYIELKAGATFTVPEEITGRPAVLSGYLVGKAPQRQLNAVGLVVD